MQIKTKIKAFTLSEMVVVLILASIVIGLAFSVLTLVQKHMSGIQNNFNKNTELNALEQSLWLDFNRYSTINYNALKDTMTFKNDMETISYHFNEKYIIKEVDTFHIEILGKQLFFDGNTLAQGTIDALKLETSKAFQNQVLFVFKENDASSYMNDLEKNYQSSFRGTIKSNAAQRYTQLNLNDITN